MTAFFCGTAKGPPPARPCPLPADSRHCRAVGGRPCPAAPDELANGYSALLYSLPVIEAILMPVMMAVLASRLWDIEIKGNTPQTALHFAEPPQPVCGQGSLWRVGGAAGHGVGAGLRAGTWARPRLHRGLSCGAAGLSVRLHTGRGLYAFLRRVSADAVGRQSPSGALRRYCGGAGRVVLCLYAAHCQLFCALWVLHSSERLRSGKLGQGHPTVTYGTRPFNWGLLAFTLALGAVLFALAWRKVQDEEV